MPHRDGHFPRFNKHEKFVGSINHFRTCYDVTFYDIDVTPDIDKKYLTGKIDIHFTTVNDFDTLLLDMDPCFKITSISSEHSSIKYKRKKDALFVVFKDKQKTGDKNVIHISYEGKADSPDKVATVHWEKDQNGKPYINTSSQGLGSYRLWPCKYLLYDKPDSSAVRITVPKGLVAVSNGKLRKKEDNETTVSYAWINHNPINIYNICFEVADFASFEIPYANGSAYVFSYNEEKAKKHFEQIPSIIKYLESVFGEYPWKNDGYKIIETPKVGGMEHQTAISCQLNYINNNGVFDDLIVHETAHEWMGNNITAFDYSDVWIHESFANYCEFLYYEHVAGHKYYMHAMNWWLSHQKKRKNELNEVPIVKPEGVRYCSWAAERDGNIYAKGAYMLHTLRCTLEDDTLFFKLLKTFYTENAKTIVRTKTFTDHVNKITGQNYDWFFKQYLYKYKVPKLVYSFEKAKDSELFEFKYQWKDTDKDFVLPIWVADRNDTIKLFPTSELKKHTTMNGINFSIVRQTGLFDVEKGL
jgi:aminopeptidase N